MRSEAMRAPAHIVDTPAPTRRPIDLVHLAHQSLGDRALEMELLTLFERQACQIVERLRATGPVGDRRWRRDLSHTLKGSARAVGAFCVADAAEAYEHALFSSATDAELEAHVAAISVAVDEAHASIRDLLADA